MIVVIETIDMDDGKKSRIGTGIAQVLARRSEFECISHQTRYQATCPFIETTILGPVYSLCLRTSSLSTMRA